MAATLIDFPRTTISSRPSPVRSPGRPSRSAETQAMYRRRRIVAAGALVATVLIFLIALQAALGRSDGGPLTTIGSAGGAQPAAAHLYVVKPGDTLWSIALASGARGDIRPLVDRLSAEVHGQPLQPGQQILVP